MAKTPGNIVDNFGVRLSTGVSANRFGVIYYPSVSYTKNNHVFCLGAAVQKKNFNPSGVQLNYEYMLMDGSKQYGSKISRLQLYAFATATYHNNVFLSRAACEEEAAGDTERPLDVSNVKLQAIDAYAGFGMRVEFLRNFKWYNAIGIGGYNVMNAPCGLYYNSRSMGLMVRTGISYQFERSTRMRL